MRIYKENEVDDQRFYKIPKSLFGNPNYKGMSAEAKLVYAFLRDRMELSKMNGWVTETGEIYLLFSRDNIGELLEMSAPTVTKAFKQLSKYELIVEKRQGLGRPNIIFVCHIELSQENQQNQKIFASGTKEILHQEIKKLCPNDTDYNETESSDTDNNDNGAFSSEERTHSLFSELTFRQEVNQARQYFEACYRHVYKKQYHRHKPNQNRYIDERLNDIFDEYGLDIDSMCEMIRTYFNNVECDHNLMHFVTDGIIQNRVYEAASY